VWGALYRASTDLLEVLTVKSLCRLLVLWLLSVVPVSAAEYFVATTGDNGNVGSEGSPWSCSKNFAASMSAGDILTYLPGVYSCVLGSSVPDGSSAVARITVRAKPINRTCSGENVAYPAEACWPSTYETVVMRGSGTRVVIEGARNWVTYEGFEVDGGGSGSFGVAVRCTGHDHTNPPTCTTGSTLQCPANIRLMNLKVYGFKDSGMIGHGHTNTEIINVETHHNGDSGLDHGVYMSGIDTKIVRLYAHHNSGLGMQAYRTPNSEICLTPGQNMLVERSLFTDNQKCGFTAAGHNWATTFRNNLSHSNVGCGASINSSGGGGHNFYANTLMHNGNVGLSILNHGDNATAINNLADRITVDGEATNVTNENNYDACPTCAQPAFVDASQHDYRLLPTDTLLIGQGQNLLGVGVAIDYDGTSRPDGAQTIGAFEKSSGAPPPFDFALAPQVVEEETPQVAQGASVDIDIVVTALLGTAAGVNFTAQNVPPQTTASFNPTGCTPSGGTCSTTMTLDTANGTPDASYQVRVLGTSDATVRTTEVPVEVNCVIP
jgi:hypothetical protein